eukprot:scaffold732_cov60-Phaeocystis_antarctica.AAC.4
MPRASSSSIFFSSQERAPGGTKRSIHGSRLARLRSKVASPPKESVGSVKTQSSSYSSAVILPDHRYSCSSKSARSPANMVAPSREACARSRGAGGGALPDIALTRAVSDETSDRVVWLVSPISFSSHLAVALGKCRNVRVHGSAESAVTHGSSSRTRANDQARDVRAMERHRGVRHVQGQQRGAAMRARRTLVREVWGGN